MICAFFFFGEVPVKIKKVKEWKQNKDKAFFIMQRTSEGEIEIAKRISDEKQFTLGQACFCKNGGKKVVRRFHFDCIHIDVRWYRYELDELVRTEETIHINEL